MDVSFIIPCYNAAKTLQSTVASIEKTCSVPYEIIIVDDGSTDETEYVTMEIIRLNNAVRLYSQCNKGVNAARKLGWSKSSGEYVCFVDADDELVLNDNVLGWLSGKYDIIKAGGWYSKNCQRVDYGNGYIGEVSDVVSAYTLVLEDKLLPYIHSAFFRKRAITEECFDINPRFKIGEDLLFYIKVMSSCRKLVSIAERFYVYSMNEESAMHTKIWGFNYIRDFNDEMENLILPYCPELKDKLTLHRFIDYTSTLLFPEVKMKQQYYMEIILLLKENLWLKGLSPKKNVIFIENWSFYGVYVRLFHLLQRLRGRKIRMVID